MTFRGERIDIGGRALRILREGPPKSRPTVLLESGSYGCAADWAEVQQRLTRKGIHSLAYDRAGLGYSDPGPRPRDGRAVCDDLEALLDAAGEDGPFVLVGHSMAGLTARLFAARRPKDVVGVVLVDATTPESMDHDFVVRGVNAYRRGAALLGHASHAGVMLPVALLMGDLIGLTGEAHLEKRRIYASGLHARWSAEEVRHWPATALMGVEAGPFPKELPVAVITAGAEHRTPRLKALQVAPARASTRGYIEHVAAANHASLLGRRHADAVVRGIEQVL